VKELLQVALLSQRPRDASYLSVVGFNSTKRRVESFIVSYVGYRFITAWCMQLNALFCCLWRNVEASCHKHFVVFFHNQHRRSLPSMCHNLRDGGLPDLHSMPPIGGVPVGILLCCLAWKN